MLVLLAWAPPALCDNIHDAVKRGDLAKVKEILTAFPQLVHGRDDYGRTPLHEAVNKDVAELLVARGADVNARDNRGRTPLHEAVNKEVAEFLVAKGADVNATDNDGITPLITAVMHGHEDVVAFLKAVLGNAKVRLAAVMKLTDQKMLANIAMTDQDLDIRFAAAGRVQSALTLVDIAKANRNHVRMQIIVELRRLLLDSNVLQPPVWISLQVENRSELYKQIPAGTLLSVKGEKIDVSIMSGDKTVITHEWVTTFPDAAPFDNPNLFQGDVARPPDVDLPAPVSLVDLFVDLCRTQHYSPSQVQMALAKVTAQDTNELIWQHALRKLNHQDDSENSFFGDISSFSRFSGIGGKGWRARVGRGGTPLHLAATEGLKDVAEALIANKAKVDAKDSDGYTPLHLAALNGRKDLAQILLANNAVVNAKDNDGHTPLFLVMEDLELLKIRVYQDPTDLKIVNSLIKDDNDMVKLLRQHGGHK